MKGALFVTTKLRMDLFKLYNPVSLPAADPVMCGRVMCYNLNRGLVLSCGEYNYRGQLGGGNEAAAIVTA